MSQNPRPRRKVSCHRHPNLPTTTGLCGPCLHERLSLLTPSTSAATAPPPQLRRCMTFSSDNRGGAIVEPRRRSCDVRGRNSLSSLFHLDNDGNSGGSIKVESRNLGLTCPVLEIREEVDEDRNAIELRKLGLGLGLTCPVHDDDESVPKARVEIARVSNFRNNKGINCNVESRKLGLSCRVPELGEEEEDDDDESLPEARVEIDRVSNFRNNVGINSNVESRKLGLTCCVPELREEDDDDDESVTEAGVEITRVSNFRNIEGVNCTIESRKLGLTCRIPELREEEEGEDDDDTSVSEARVEIARVCDLEQGKSMKEFIDLELKSSSKSRIRISNNRKDFKEIAGSFLSKASVFSKNLRKWRKKQECSKRDAHCSRNCNGDGKCIGDNGVGLSLGELRIENLRGRRLSYTQSEVGDYGFGRRSCDTDPRGSLDLGRASIDCGAFGRNSCDSDPRFSIDLGRASVDCGRVLVGESKGEYFEAPRASWDGYMGGGGGGRALPRRGGAPVVSVIENAMASVYGFDDRVLGEREVKIENGDGNDYLLTRRKGFDRCSSVKRDMVVMSEDGEAQALLSAKVSPATIGIFNGTKMMISDKESSEWRLNSVKDDSSESFETASKDLGSVSSSSIGADNRKCRQWSKLWSFWGMLHGRKGDKCGNDGKPSGADGGSSNDMAKKCKTGNLMRSNSTSSSRGISSVQGSSSGTSSRTESKRRQDEGVLERNRSGHVENGLLRLYLTPLRRRSRSRLGGTSRLKKSHSLARSVLM